MHINWRAVANIGAKVAEVVGVPGAIAIEQNAEEMINAPSGIEKAEQAVETGIKVLETEGAIAGKNYATPRVKTAMLSLSNASVELVNALEEAHSAKP